MHILVTGGAGFIGSNFVKHVLQTREEYHVTVVDKLTYAGNVANLREVEATDRFAFVQGDISDAGTVSALMRQGQFTAVVNFAAESHVDRSLHDASPFVKTNIVGTHVMLEAARKNELERFVQISTDEVYGALGESGVFTESSCLRPTNPYAASKAAADLLAQSYWRSYDAPILICRSTNNYGAFQYPEKLIPLMIRNILVGRRLPVYGQGRQIRDWLHVEDNCRGILSVLENGSTGSVYNLGGGCEMRNIEIVQRICEEAVSRSEEVSRAPAIEFIADPRGSSHDYRYALDCTKARDELGWVPSWDLETGLGATVQWYLENMDWAEEVLGTQYDEYYTNHYRDRG